jgi:hypothetical protein
MKADGVSNERKAKPRRRTAKQERAESLRRDHTFLTMHKAQCSICKHPQFKEIEAAYLEGQSMVDITFAYGMKDTQPLVRHVQAFKLRTLREAKAAKSSRLLARHILSLCRFNADNPPNKETVLLAMRMQHEAEMAELPKKLHLSGSIETKLVLIPAAEEMARNILLRMGVDPKRVEQYLPSASFDAIVKLGLGKQIEEAEDEYSV